MSDKVVVHNPTVHGYYMKYSASLLCMGLSLSESTILNRVVVWVAQSNHCRVGIGRLWFVRFVENILFYL